MIKVTDTETFIQKAKSIHKDKYDYSKVNYINYKELVTIKCNTCGTEFNQRAKEHIRVRHSGKYTNVNGGCPECRKTKIGKDNSHTLESLKDKILQCFDLTNYSLELITESNMKDRNLPIICKQHGLQYYSRKLLTDINHLSKYPCKFCNSEIKEMIKTLTYNDTSFDIVEEAKKHFAIFYIIKIQDFYKFGITTRSIYERYKSFLDVDYEIIQEINTNLYLACKLEAHIKNYVEKNNFKYVPNKMMDKAGGKTECFKLS